MAEKKPTTKKTTAPSKAKTKSSTPKKVQNSGNAKAKTTKKAEPKKVGPHRNWPDWMKHTPERFAVGTEDYRKLIEYHNEKTGSAYNPWRVRPAVLYSIHETVVRLLSEELGNE